MWERRSKTDITLVSTQGNGEPVYEPNINVLASGPMPDKHLMLDIETYDTEVTAVILSIAAVVFDPRGFLPFEEFNTTVNPDSQPIRTTSQATIEWWSQQDELAAEATFGGAQLPLHLALVEFTQWLNKLRPTCTRIWAKSPDFDCLILSHACKQQNIIWPFKFWETRCCRTIMELAYPLGDFPVVEVDGALHDALVDAKKQVVEVQHAFHILGI